MENVKSESGVGKAAISERLGCRNEYNTEINPGSVNFFSNKTGLDVKLEILNGNSDEPEKVHIMIHKIQEASTEDLQHTTAVAEATLSSDGNLQGNIDEATRMWLLAKLNGQEQINKPESISGYDTEDYRDHVRAWRKTQENLKPTLDAYRKGISTHFLGIHGAHPFEQVEGKITVIEGSRKGIQLGSNTKSADVYVNVDNLAPGEGGYTTPWGIKESTTIFIERHPYGTCCVPIWRTTEGDVKWDQKTIDDYNEHGISKVWGKD